MKDSGAEWLGRIPAHWGVFRFKVSTISCQNGLWGGDPDGSNDIECVRVADFDRQALSINADIPTLRSITQKERVGRLLRPGNLLLEKSGGGENQPVGQVVLYDRVDEAICSNFIAKIQLAPGMDPGFWNYQHYASYAARINVRSIKQTSGIQNLDQHQYLSELAAFPSFEEQVAITSYLDRATARIDTMVAKKTRFIELLCEKRQALIMHTVTKGLDPNVPMKDSGIEWLGKVPAHWGLFRLKQSIISCQNGLWGGDPNGSHDIECVRVADFDRPSLSVNADIPTLRAITMKERSGRILRRGNLLLEKSGGGESQPVGQVVLYDRESEAICSNFIAKIELAPGMDPRFWNYQHHAAYVARINVKSIKQTSGIQNLDQHQYLSELAAFPLIEEQAAIADYLDRATSRIDVLITKTKRSIELLREHRTALITAAVTGKIDLRPAA